MAGGDPLTVQDIVGFLDLIGESSPEAREAFLGVIRRMDRVYLEHQARANKNKT